MLAVMNRPHQPLTSRTFDAAVVGGGYAGFAAVERLRAAGWSVVLIDRRVALLWESGWAFHDLVGTCDLPGFIALQGAAAEVEAAVRAKAEHWDVFGYATPIAVTVTDDRLVDVALGTKSGIQRIRARRWLDASDDGELVRLLGAVPSAPSRRRIAIHRAVPGAAVSERIAIDLQPGERLAEGWLRVAQADPASVVSHGSVVPWCEWEGAAEPVLPANMACAVPAFARGPLPTLASRYAHGWEAAGRLLAAPAATPADGPLPVVIARELPLVDVAIAGTGTGGALAALAAGRAGASVSAFDPLPFAGGIGAGGGIHWYYFGVTGGLQSVLDARVRELMPRFGSGAQVQGFHPDAKKCALDGLLSEAGVEPFTGTLIEVRRDGRTIREALVATPQGPVRVRAKSWADGTGDGDLCAAAGCASRFGRAGDGLPHAYSQSSGRISEKDGKVHMQVVNFDQGFTDPTDVEDLTRARIEGIAQYRQGGYAGREQPTYIAPAIGLRQSRHIETVATLQLDDLITRATFPDAVGVTGCHYDNHASDYEFESDEGMFWVWACRAWSQRIACEIPYGILVPKDLDNAWIACRALGVSQDAHHSLRMQRDMQRIGEVAGLAAVQAARTGRVDLAALQQELRASGALGEPRTEEASVAGPDFGPALDRTQLEAAISDIRDLEWGKAGPAMWRLYRSDDASALRALLAEPLVSWRAATVLAMRGDIAALPRLWQAIEAREHGFEDQPEHLRPEQWNRVVPVWRQAIALLRRCGTATDIDRLDAVLAGEELTSSLGTLVATTVERLAQRGERAQRAAALLDRCAAAIAGAVRDPQQNPSHIAKPAEAATSTWRAGVRIDASWQLACAVAKARCACGLPMTATASADERAVVRRAFASLARAAAAR